MANGRWVQVVVAVRRLDVELLADRLWRFEPVAIEERETGHEVLLVAGFDDPSRAAAAARSLEPVLAADVRTVVDDGLDGWRRWAVAVPAPPFLIVPAWQDPPEVDEARMLRIEPGRTFGSGSHPTTRLVLRALAELLGGAPPATPVAADGLLDVGCGSGILAVAAALLGADRVTAIDVDPEAPEVTSANAERNGVAGAVSASNTSLAEVAATGSTFAVVVANLLATVVVDLADDLVRVMAPGATLVVSGLLADRWRDTTVLLRGVEVVGVTTEDGWAAVSLRRPPHGAVLPAEPVR